MLCSVHLRSIFTSDETQLHFHESKQILLFAQSFYAHFRCDYAWTYLCRYYERCIVCLKYLSIHKLCVSFLCVRRFLLIDGQMWVVEWNVCYLHMLKNFHFSSTRAQNCQTRAFQQVIDWPWLWFWSFLAQQKSLYFSLHQQMVLSNVILPLSRIVRFPGGPVIFRTFHNYQLCDD